MISIVATVLRIIGVAIYTLCQIPCICVPFFFGKLFFPSSHAVNLHIRSVLPPLSTGVYLLFFGIQLSAQVSKSIPGWRPGVSRFLLMTHSSTLDFMTVTTAVWIAHKAIGSLVCIVKKEVMNMPFFGWIQHGAGSVPVSRSGDLEAAKRNLAVGEERCRDGYLIAGFPEGSRRRTPSVGRDQLQQFKKGMFHMAKNVTKDGGKVQFIPLVMVGGNAAWPTSSLLPIPGSKVTVRLGDAIDMKDGETVDEVTARVRICMQDEIERTGAVLPDGSYSVDAAFAKGVRVNLWKEYGLEAALMAVPGLVVAALAILGKL